MEENAMILSNHEFNLSDFALSEFVRYTDFKIG